MYKIGNIFNNVSIPIEFEIHDNNLQVSLSYVDGCGDDITLTPYSADIDVNNFIMNVSKNNGENVRHFFKHAIDGRGYVSHTYIMFLWNGSNNVLEKRIMEEKMKL